MARVRPFYRDEYVLARPAQPFDPSDPFRKPVPLGSPEDVIQQLQHAMPTVKGGRRDVESFGKLRTQWQAGFADDRYDLLLDISFLQDSDGRVVGISVTVDQGYLRSGLVQSFDVLDDGSYRESARRKVPMPPKGYALASLRTVASAVGCSIFTTSEELVE